MFISEKTKLMLVIVLSTVLYSGLKPASSAEPNHTLVGSTLKNRFGFPHFNKMYSTKLEMSEHNFSLTKIRDNKTNRCFTIIENNYSNQFQAFPSECP